MEMITEIISVSHDILVYGKAVMEEVYSAVSGLSVKEKALGFVLGFISMFNK